MHIPDSVLSPSTSLAAAAAMAPVWLAASRRVRATLSTRDTPLLALSSAFCFVIMMFNLPVFGGTTTHPLGAVLMAVLLGPWAAVIGMTSALAVQALFFADGGILALGANCFAMAFAMPFVGFCVYRLAAGRSSGTSARRAAAAGLGAYVGIVAASAVVAVLLGIQPALFQDASGRPLYFPFGLSVTLPAILAAHLTVGGMAEAVVTFSAIRCLQTMGVPLWGTQINTRSACRWDRLWVGLGALAALAPLGLLASGDAWGEWSATELAARAGHMPSGLAAMDQAAWKGFQLLPDYLSDLGPGFYVLAAFTGIAITGAAVALLSKRLMRVESAAPTVSEPATAVHTRSLPPTATLPAWLQAEQVDSVSAASRSKRASVPNAYAERTLQALSVQTLDTLRAEEVARSDGFLQALDARTKLASLVALMVVCAFLHTIPGLCCLVLLAAYAGHRSNLNIGRLQLRVWAAAPLLVGAVALPAATHFVNPGSIAFIAWRDPYVAVTWPGLTSATVLILRVAVAGTLAALLVLSTPRSNLFGAMQYLRLPRMFTSVFAMTLRYISVVAEAAVDLFVARKSRTIGKSRLVEARGFVGRVCGFLFGRSLALAEEVHDAMVSRGYSGQVHVAAPSRVAACDVAWLACTLLIGAGVLWGESLAL